jgi:LysM repeat protein
MYSRIKILKPAIVLTFIALSFLVFTDTGSTAYRPVVYQTVHVNSGDSLWSIASKYVTDKDDIRNYIAMIQTANHLNSNSQIHPGQQLIIPIHSN